MLYRLLILIIAAAHICTAALAQVDPSEYNVDTLSHEEEQKLHAAYRQSSFGYLYLTDSFSEVGDSINASNYFIKIDPYILFPENISPDSLQWFVLKYDYKITKAALKEFTARYKKAYYAPKSALYSTLKKMKEEDQRLRTEIELCRDSACSALTDKRMRESDSVHFDYLYRYVKTNGWPSLKNGSLFAALIALHDHAHHGEYLPLLKEAVMKGEGEMTVLETVFYWNAHANDYAWKLKEAISKGKYEKIDVTCMLSNQPVSVSTMAKIKNFVTKHCPVSFFYIFESHHDRKIKEWDKKDRTIPRSQSVISQLSVELAYYNCNVRHSQLLGMQTGCWSVRWMPSDHEEPKLIMYLLYDRDSVVSPTFNKIITEKKFVTHDIHFDVNKSLIKPESTNFVDQLAAWLKQNPSIKLEIDGHTDSDGDSVANIKLSQARADEVKKQLVARGIAESRLTTNGYGATKPIKPNTTETGKAENRRVEFIKK